MKSLISSTLILLALYAQACSAQESNARLVFMNSHQQYSFEQITSLQPTLLIPLQQPQYGFIAYTRVNRHQSSNNQGIIQHHTSETLGFGLHHQINNWMQTQVVVQTQQYRRAGNELESMMSLAVQF